MDNLLDLNRDISSTPVVCDFNNDGKKEISVATKGDSLSYIYAIKHDGTLMPGFNGSLSSARIAYPTKASAAICHSISVGDINNDGNLEVVALGCDNVRAWKNDGSLLLDYNIDGLFPNNAYAENITPPLLADVNGDSLPEILFNMQNSIYAIDFEGNCVSGFPIITDAEINNTISVSDVDADGKNEILATSRDLGLIYLWKTLGSSSSIEWGRSLFNSENTSEYIGGYRDQLVVTHDFLWQGGEFTNDIIIRSGIFTIPENVTLAMRRPYRIYVMDGAELRVIGGRIENADILVKEGASISITIDSEVYLRSSGGKIATEIGANVNILSGLIE